MYMCIYFYRSNNGSGEGIRNTRALLKPLNLKDVSKMKYSILFILDNNN